MRSTPLPLPQALVGREKERPAAPDRTAHRSTKLVPVERVRILGRELEEVPRIECIVPQELERLGAQAVGTRPRDDVDDRPGHVPVVGAEHGAVDLELLNAGERRLEHQRSERQVVGRHAVDHEPDSLFTIAGRIEGQRTDAANGP